MSSSEKVLKATIKLVDNFTRPMDNAVRRTRELGNTHRELAKRLGKPLNFLFKMDSRVHSYLNKIKAQYTRLKTSFKDYIKVKIEANKAIATINILKRHFSALKNLKSFKALVSLKDKVSGTLSKITGKIKSFASKMWKATVAVKDKASSILSSIQGKLTALAGGVTIGVAVKESLGGAMQLQQDKTTIRHFMGVGNSGKDKTTLDKMASDYSSWLTNNANMTPFTNAEVMAGGAKALTATGGNVEKAKEMLARAEDMAGLMGKPLEQAVDALMDVNIGQYARLTEFGMSMEGGEKGDKPDDVLKEIDRRFGGGAGKLSESAKGKMSTATGKLSASLSQVGTVFLDPLATSFDKVSGLIDSFTPKLVEVAEKAKETFGAFMQSEQANQYMQIFKTVGETVFNAIKAVIDAVKPVVESIFTFIGEHSTEISAIVKALGAIWNSVWKTVGVLLKGAWGICEPILSLLLKALAKVSGAVEKICNWWNKMVDLLKKPINTVVNISKKLFGGGDSEGNNAFGSGRIARDGTVRTLHEGEKILTKQEANRYEKGQSSSGVNITINGLTVREEADITKIANKLVQKINQNKVVFGGAY